MYDGRLLNWTRTGLSDQYLSLPSKQLILTTTDMSLLKVHLVLPLAHSHLLASFVVNECSSTKRVDKCSRKLTTIPVTYCSYHHPPLLRPRSNCQLTSCHHNSPTTFWQQLTPMNNRQSLKRDFDQRDRSRRSHLYSGKRAGLFLS